MRYTVHFRALSWEDRGGQCPPGEGAPEGLHLREQVLWRRGGQAPRPSAQAPYHHSGHVTLLGGRLPLVHLEVSEHVDEGVLPNWEGMQA